MRVVAERKRVCVATNPNRAPAVSDVDPSQRLLQIVSEATDRSVLSEELARAVFDHDSAIAFSRQRHCLLRPLRIGHADRVLEIGGRFGALARYLGEVGAKVVSVDAGEKSAQVGRLRCADLPNVNIIREESLNPSTAAEQSVVVLVNGVVGDLDWTRVELRERLSLAYESLGESGSLVFSAENRLGLKYLSGARSASHDQPFQALNTPLAAAQRPLDVAEALGEVRGAGFVEAELLLPFPDHVFPKAILRSSAMGADGVSLENALWGIYGRDLGVDWHAFIDEHRIWGSLQHNEAAAALANSFMIIARKSPETPSIVDGSDAWRYTIGNRYSRLAKSLKVSRPNATGDRTVEAEPLQPAEVLPELRLASGYSGRQHIDGAQFVHGPTEAVVIAREFGGSDTAVVGAYMRWAAHVLSRARCTSPEADGLISSWVLPGDCVELIPQNMIWRDEEHEPFVFDNEPRLDQEVPLVWVLYRGIIQCVRYHDPARILRAVGEILAVNVLDADVELARRLESEMVDAFEFVLSWSEPGPQDLGWYQTQLSALEGALKAERAAKDAVLARRSVRLALRFARGLRRPIKLFRAITR